MTEKNTIYLLDAVNEESVDLVIEQFNSLENKKQDIYFFIKSPGGSVNAGERLIYFLSKHPNIHTVVIEAYSMAAFIVEALPGKRYMSLNGTMMFHKVYRYLVGPRAITQEEMSEILSDMVQTNRFYGQRNSSRMGMGFHLYMNKVRKDWWLTYKEALEYNAVDSIVSIRPIDASTVRACEL